MDSIMNNKWVVIGVTALLVVAVVVLGVMYSQKSGDLSEAESQINILAMQVNDLEDDLAASEAEVASLETNLAASEAEVTSLESDLATAQADLSAAESEIDTLETDLAAAQAEVASLEADLAAAEADAASLEADLADAQAEVASLEAELAAAQAELADAIDELAVVKDPRHFNSRNELQSWLEQDNTDTQYDDESTYNYVYILQIRALRDGYILPANFEDIDLDYVADVAGNLAFINGNIYLVWPFSDDVELWFYAEDVPSRPLPLD